MILNKNPNIATFTSSLDGFTDFKNQSFDELSYIPYLGIESQEFGQNVDLNQFFSHFELKVEYNNQNGTKSEIPVVSTMAE